MSFAKRQMEREEELVFSLPEPDRAVCPDCIQDPALRRFVASHAQIDRCAFCGGPGPYGISLVGLFEYMAGCLTDE